MDRRLYLSVQEIMPQGAHLLHASAAHHGTGGLAMCRLGYYCFGRRDGVMRTANVSDGGGGSENKLVGGRVAAGDSGRPSRATAGRSRSRPRGRASTQDVQFRREKISDPTKNRKFPKFRKI
jgi:hypothetical protein